jgi:peroxiredoxin Q/BCP
MEKTRPPEVSAVAPDFTLPDQDGTARRLADLCADEPLVLVFYRGHW